MSKFLIFLVTSFMISCGTYDVAKERVAPHVHPLRKNTFPHCTTFDVVYKSKVRRLTNAHCCLVSEGIKEEGLSVYGYVVDIIKFDSNVDLCEISYSTDKLGGLQFSSKDVRVMDKIISVGFPSYYDKTIREGRVNGSFSTPLNSSMLNIAGFPIFGGASGSPVTNEDGSLVGVISVRNEFFEGGFIPHKVVEKFLDE